MYVDCGFESNTSEDYKLGELISVNHRYGCGSMHGGGKQLM